MKHKSKCKCGKRRTRCRTCKGGTICPCGKNRYICKICSPQNFCPCGVRKDTCVICIPLDKLLARAGFCNVCGQTRTVRACGICVKCDTRKRKRIEHQVWDHIRERVPTPSSKDNKMTGATCAKESMRRPDFSWVLPHGLIFLEIDEYSHRNRQLSCEVAKMDATKWGLHTSDQTKPIIFLRFNPNIHTEQRQPLVTLAERCDTLVHMIHKTIKRFSSISCAPRIQRGTVLYMFYGKSGQKHIQHAKQKGFEVFNIN